MKRPAHTLLLIDSNAITRADFSAPGALPLRVLEGKRAADANLEGAVKAGLANGGAPGKQVWVAVDDIWSQVLALPVAVVSGLTPVELASTLAAETEPLSGILAANAALGYVQKSNSAQAGAHDFPVIAMDLFARDDIQFAIQKAGATLRGICNVHDLPPPSSTPNTDERERLQRCLNVLVQNPAAIPVISPAPRQIKPTRYWVTALLLETAVLVLCFFHLKGLQRDTHDARAASEALQKPRQLLEALKTKITASKAELAKLEDSNALTSGLLETIAQNMSRQRRRIPALLESLGRNKPVNAALNSIQAMGADGERVEGLSLAPTDADSYVLKLDAALAGVGLRAQALSKTAQRIDESGGPWQFVIQVVPVPPAEGVPSSAVTARNANAEVRR
jgi:hypothetical protein